MNKNLITTIVLIVVLLGGVGYYLYAFTDVFSKSDKENKTEETATDGEYIVNENTRILEGLVARDVDNDLSIFGLKLKYKEDLASYEGKYLHLTGEMREGNVFEIFKLEVGENPRDIIMNREVLNLEGEVSEDGKILSSVEYGDINLTGDNTEHAGSLKMFSLKKEAEGYSIVSAIELEMVSGEFKIIDKEKFIYQIGETTVHGHGDMTIFHEEGLETIVFVTTVDGKKMYHRSAGDSEMN